MNKIREVQRLNERELATVVPPNASWHTDYRDTAYIYIGGLPLELSEGDVVTIFSQYGEPVWLRLMRDKETGKSKGFAWLKYEDQRSCDLAVDNLGGATVMGRLLAVDHTRYQKKENEDEDEFYVGQDKKVDPDQDDNPADDTDEEQEEDRPMLKEEIELAKLMRDHDEDDPMKAYMIEQKKEEIAEARKALVVVGKKDDRKSKHRSSHRSTRHDSEDRHRSHRSTRHRSEDEDRHRSHRRRPSPRDDREKTRERRSPSAERDSKYIRRERHRSDRDRSYSPVRDSRRDKHRSSRGDSRSPVRDSRRDRY